MHVTLRVKVSCVHEPCSRPREITLLAPPRMSPFLRAASDGSDPASARPGVLARCFSFRCLRLSTDPSRRLTRVPCSRYADRLRVACAAIIATSSRVCAPPCPMHPRPVCSEVSARHTAPMHSPRPQPKAVDRLVYSHLQWHALPVARFFPFCIGVGSAALPPFHVTDGPRAVRGGGFALCS